MEFWRAHLLAGLMLRMYQYGLLWLKNGQKEEGRERRVIRLWLSEAHHEERGNRIRPVGWRQRLGYVRRT